MTLAAAAWRAQQRADLTLVPPVNAEVTFINSDDEVTTMNPVSAIPFIVARSLSAKKD
jgi:hypothetical protein